jgi:hypothetical protein
VSPRLPRDLSVLRWLKPSPGSGTRSRVRRAVTCALRPTGAASITSRFPRKRALSWNAGRILGEVARHFELDRNELLEKLFR